MLSCFSSWGILATVQNMEMLQAAQIAQELQDTVVNVTIPIVMNYY
jgi:hypothetical protein